MTRAHFKAQPGLFVCTQGQKVTDRAQGHELALTPDVREHERLGRLLRVNAAPAPPVPRPRPARSAQEPTEARKE
jgi:hypothetical protein